MKIRTLSWLLIGGVFSSVLIYAGVLIFLTWPISELSINSSGVFGDSFGILTSLFSGLAFAGLIITIVMQREELALQRQELNLTRQELSGQKQEMQAQNETLRIQRFESTFFKMLEFLDGCRNDIFYQRETFSYQGRDAVKSLYKVFTEEFLCELIYDKVARNHKSIFREECKMESGIVEQYNLFYEEYGDELGQYYRCLYNILKLVDRADFIHDKTIYTNLIRAQLSRYELALLFYNGISEFGREKMLPLVRKYRMLKHLEVGVLPDGNIPIWEHHKRLG